MDLDKFRKSGKTGLTRTCASRAPANTISPAARTAYFWDRPNR
jgi:hypothetical protein